MKAWIGITAFLLLCSSSVTHADTNVSGMERFYNRKIAELIFDDALNLNYQDFARSIPLKPGDILTEDKLAVTVQRLSERGIFDSVVVDPAFRGDDVVLLFHLSSKTTVSKISFSGARQLQEKDLNRFVPIRPGSQYDPEKVAAAQSAIVAKYRDVGCLSAAVRAELSKSPLWPQVAITFAIDEGYQSTISALVIQGDFPEELKVAREQFIAAAVGQPATKEQVKLLRQELLLLLRREGYLQASIEVADPKINTLTGNVELTFSVLARDPVTIIFEGNDHLSPAELLSPLKMETRTVPFTPNAIGSLTAEIINLYQQYGFYYAAVTSQRLKGKSNRNVFRLAINEGPVVSVSKIIFEGNDHISNGELSRQIETKTAGVWLLRRWWRGYVTDRVLASDTDKIRDLYEVRGFGTAAVDARVARSNDSSKLTVVFSIREGDVKTLRQVNVEWNDGDGGLPAWLPVPTIAVGDPFDAEKVRAEQTQLLTTVLSKGYPNARVTISSQEEKGVLTYTIEPGPFVQVGDIKFAGNIFTHDAVIRRFVPLKRGEPWSMQKMRDIEQGLYSSGLFQTAAVNPADGALDGPIEDVVVSVVERDTGLLESELGIDTEDGLHIAGALAQKNLVGSGNSLAFSVDGFLRTGDQLLDAGTAKTVYGIPRFLGTDGELFNELFAQYSIDLVDQFSYDRFGFSSSFRYPLTEKLSTTLNYRSYRERVFDAPTDVVIGPDDQGSTFYSLMRGEVDLDRRDDVYNPRSGYHATIGGNVASGAIGSEANLYGANARLAGFLPVTRRTVWANAIEGTLVRAFGDTDVVPISRRLFLGGRSSLRGFSRNSVGPRGFEQDIVGGDTSIRLSSELQYDISEKVVGVGFIDAGQAILREQGSFTGDPLSFFSDFRYSPGIGLRYKTPIGPLSVDYGFALNREFGERFGRLNIGFGLSF